MAGPVALVGAGEYLPVMLEVERALLQGRPARYVQIPTAAAPEGPAVLQRWIELGRAQAERLGVEAVPLAVADREAAEDPQIAGQVAGAGLIYLSGGNPAFLADTLRGTALWRAIVEAWQAGSALAGCSAGAMACGDWVPDVRDPTSPGTPGLGLLPTVRVIPHFDRFAGWMPDLPARYAASLPAGHALLGIDEDTALVSTEQPGVWRVAGHRTVWQLGPGDPVQHQVGASLRLVLG